MCEPPKPISRKEIITIVKFLRRESKLAIKKIAIALCLSERTVYRMLKE